jgi:hypothetical protein
MTDTRHKEGGLLQSDTRSRRSCARSWRGLISLVGAIATTACSSGTAPNVACTLNYVYGLAIRVQNAATGSALSDSALVQVMDGAYVETYRYLGPPNQQFSGTISAAGERAGTYSIAIRKAGFAPFDTAGIRVTRDACHVHTVTVIANLQPVTGG